MLIKIYLEETVRTKCRRMLEIWRINRGRPSKGF